MAGHPGLRLVAGILVICLCGSVETTDGLVKIANKQPPGTNNATLFNNVTMMSNLSMLFTSRTTDKRHQQNVTEISPSDGREGSPRSIFPHKSPSNQSADTSSNTSADPRNDLSQNKKIQMAVGGLTQGQNEHKKNDYGDISWREQATVDVNCTNTDSGEITNHTVAGEITNLTVAGSREENTASDQVARTTSLKNIDPRSPHRGNGGNASLGDRDLSRDRIERSGSRTDEEANAIINMASHLTALNSSLSTPRSKVTTEGEKAPSINNTGFEDADTLTNLGGLYRNITFQTEDEDLRKNISLLPLSYRSDMTSAFVDSRVKVENPFGKDNGAKENKQNDLSHQTPNVANISISNENTTESDPEPDPESESGDVLKDSDPRQEDDAADEEHTPNHEIYYPPDANGVFSDGDDELKEGQSPAHETEHGQETEVGHINDSLDLKPEESTSESNPEEAGVVNSEFAPEVIGGADGESEYGPGEEGGNSEKTYQDVESEVEGDGTAEPDGLMAEPVPDWNIAKQEWGIALEVHVYLVGGLYLVLAFHSLVCLIRLWQWQNLQSRAYFIWLHIILLVLGTGRALYFFVDGYNFNDTFPTEIAYMMLSVGFPCLTSAFTLMWLSLLRALQMEAVLPNIQHPASLAVTVVSQILFSVVTDIVVAHVASTRVMLIVCEAVLMGWGVILFVCYLYLTRRLYSAAIWRHKQTVRYMEATDSTWSPNKKKASPHLPYVSVIVMMLIAAVTGLLLVCVHTYGLIKVYNLFSLQRPKPWPWWAFMLSARVLELIMCFLITFMASRFMWLQYLESSDGCSCIPVTWCPCCHSTVTPDRHPTGEYSHTNELESHQCMLDISSSHQCMLDGSSSPLETSADNMQISRPDDALVENTELPSADEDLCLSSCKRPKSMLVYEDGYIRFRTEGDSDIDLVAVSTDEELDGNDGMVKNDQQMVYWTPFHHPGGYSVPLTPATPRSVTSTDPENDSGVFNFKVPSSIHLRDSIENALDLPRFSLNTPETVDLSRNGTPSLPPTPASLPNSQRPAAIGRLRQWRRSSANSFRNRLARSHRNYQSACDLKIHSTKSNAPSHGWTKNKAEESDLSLNLTRPPSSSGLSRPPSYTHMLRSPSYTNVYTAQQISLIERTRSKSESLADSQNSPLYSDV